MFVATVIISVLLAAMLSMSAYFKITRRPQFVEGYAAIGVPDSWLNPLAGLLLAGAAGLLVGLWWAPIGIAAAAGLILYFLGGIGFHVKAKDWKSLPVPTVMLILSIVVLVLRCAMA
ncbi:DoxX family protein [Nocardia sp. GCM10030253]|uniref:DoxX family protein n=1 Tax=Nocardia sp. GCM10030253 TaxID=3273404 RepID=UPI003628A24E